MFDDNFYVSILRIPIILISITLHEVFHGMAAYLCGDSTAKYDGRLSLNPLKHMDPVGTICMILFGFGWAKPVMVNYSNLKNPRWNPAFISLAGPVANIILAIFSLLFLYPMGNIETSSSFLSFIENLLMQSFYFNIGIAAFNLVPIPPLDGSKILAAFLPRNAREFLLYKMDRYSMIILIILMFTNTISYLISPIINIIYPIVFAFVEGFYKIF